MKKKLLGGLLVVAIAAVAAFNVNMNTEKSELSLLALANVEALAGGESGTADGYKIHDKDCKVKQTVSFDGTITLAGKKLKVGGIAIGGIYEKTYYSAARDCEKNKGSFECISRTCEQFYSSLRDL